MSLTILDFENADIGRLAVHLAEAWRPVPAQALAVVTAAGVFTPWTGYGLLLGFSFTDTSGAVNTLTLADAQNAAGPVLASHTVAASESVTVPIPVPGVLVQRGLTVSSTGAGTAVLYVARHVRHD